MVRKLDPSGPDRTELMNRLASKYGLGLSEDASPTEDTSVSYGLDIDEGSADVNQPPKPPTNEDMLNQYRQNLFSRAMAAPAQADTLRSVANNLTTKPEELKQAGTMRALGGLSQALSSYLDKSSTTAFGAPNSTEQRKGMLEGSQNFEQTLKERQDLSNRLQQRAKETEEQPLSGLKALQGLESGALQQKLSEQNLAKGKLETESTQQSLEHLNAPIDAATKARLKEYAAAHPEQEGLSDQVDKMTNRDLQSSKWVQEVLGRAPQKVNLVGPDGKVHTYETDPITGKRVDLGQSEKEAKPKVEFVKEYGMFVDKNGILPPRTPKEMGISQGLSISPNGYLDIETLPTITQKKAVRDTQKKLQADFADPDKQISQMQSVLHDLDLAAAGNYTAFNMAKLEALKAIANRVTDTEFKNVAGSPGIVAKITRAVKNKGLGEPYEQDLKDLREIVSGSLDSAKALRNQRANSAAAMLTSTGIPITGGQLIGDLKGPGENTSIQQNLVEPAKESAQPPAPTAPPQPTQTALPPIPKGLPPGQEGEKKWIPGYEEKAGMVFSNGAWHNIKRKGQ